MITQALQPEFRHQGRLNPPPTVMIVDDSENHRRMCRLYLENEGYRVYCAENGAQGVDRARSMPPDLILLDIMMPVMDGHEMLENLKNDRRLMRIPVIMVTVESAGSDRLKAFDAGASDYLNKPVNLDELLAKVKIWIGIKRERERLEAQTRRLQDQKSFLKDEIARLAAFEDELRQDPAAPELYTPGHLSSKMVHDFNNMFFRVMGNIELAMLESPPDFPATRHLENALVAAGLARKLLQEIPDRRCRQPSGAVTGPDAGKSAAAVNDAEMMAGSGEHILLVDDEEAIVNMQKQTLERFNYSITPCTSSVEALEDFRRQPGKYHLVITDMVMPEKTGAQLAEDLLAIRPDIPIIMCTGWSEPVDENQAMAIGIRSYLKKPVTRLDLARTVRDVLDGKENGERALVTF